MSTATLRNLSTNTRPYIAPNIPWYTRLRYTFSFHALQFLFKAVFFLSHFFIGSRNAPTYIKSYPSHPSLKNRFFIPQTTLGEGDETRRYPLYINLHGGGFALMDPLIDDRHNSYYCHTHKVVVVSLDYYKSPTHRFPVAVNALTDLVLSVLSDDSLSIDRSKVVIGGASAGATLALAVSQDERLQGRIHGAICLCPVLDFTCDDERVEYYEMLKGKGGNVLPLDGVRGFSACYVNEGQDLTDPRLSPAFANRGDLPGKLWVLGCELDGLCAEAERWVQGLVGGKGEGNVWEMEGVRWEKVMGEEHGFDTMIGRGEDKRRREARGLVMRQDIAEWLFREVYV